MLMYYLFNCQEEECLTSFNLSSFMMILCIPIETIFDSYYKIQYNTSVGSIRYVALCAGLPNPYTILDIGLDQGSSHPFNNCEL